MFIPEGTVAPRNRACKRRVDNIRSGARLYCILTSECRFKLHLAQWDSDLQRCELAIQVAQAASGSLTSSLSGLRASVNKHEQNLHQEYLTRLRLTDKDLLRTPDGVVGPLGAWFTSVTNPDDFKGWAVGFHHEWSDELAKLPEMLADAQVARWQSKYGRDPTDQQRSWLVNKIRTDIAMSNEHL